MRLPARRRLRRFGYGVFYALPFPIRRRLVRVVVPKYIVGAVALVRDAEATDTDRLLLLRQPPGMGWTLPAGLLRRGESPIEGCARELAEETGITLGREQLTPSVPSAVVHHRGAWVDVVFDARVPASQVQFVVDGAEVLEAQFHRVDNLPPLTPPTARLLSYYGIGPLVEYPEVRT